jgi:mannitol/fructose-specific phosphotransferase system IIA component
MRKTRLLIQLPTPLKQKLDALRSKGYTASGFIRALLEREFSQPTRKQKGA